MNYSKIYNTIVNHVEFKQIVVSQLQSMELRDLLEIVEIHQKDWQGFPYLLVMEEYNEKTPVEYMARYLSISMDLSPLCSDASEYYFPFVCIPEHHPTLSDHLMSQNLEASIAHEVCHIRDILKYVDENPNYYDDLTRYSLTYIEDPMDIEKSIRFEIEKRLYLEPSALRVEYEMGVTSIPIPVLFFVKHYHCDSVQEFIKCNLYGELKELPSIYKKKFPDKKEEIDSLFKKVITTTENEYTGENGYLEIQDIYRKVYSKLGVPGYM